MNLEKEIEEAQALVESLKAKQAEQKKKRTGKIMCGSELEAEQLYYATYHAVYLEPYSTPRIDDQIIAVGRAYFDEESAKLAMEKAEIIHRMAIAARECKVKVDWYDAGQYKHYLYWNFKAGEALASWDRTTKSSSMPYFTDKHKLEAFKNSLSAHELWVLLVWDGDL